jgi:hypothetical protein
MELTSTVTGLALAMVVALSADVALALALVEAELLWRLRLLNQRCLGGIGPGSGLILWLQRNVHVDHLAILSFESLPRLKGEHVSKMGRIYFAGATVLAKP